MTTRTTITTTTTTAMPDAAALYRLMTWLSPAYPIGAFSYSHGLEYAVEAGLVHDEASLADYVATVLRHGAGAVDASLLAAAWRAGGEAGRLAELAELAAAWRGTGETAREAADQGRAFLDTTRAAWPAEGLPAAGQLAGGPALAVAVGAAAAAHGIALAPALAGYLTALAANLVSAGVRLVPLGQTAGQRTTARLEAAVAAAVADALDTDPEAVGTASPMLDWCSFRHETQYTRLFRS